MSIKLDSSDFQNKLSMAILKETVNQDKILKDITQIIYDESNKLAPKDTGKMIENSEIIKTPDGYDIVYKEDYSVYVHEDLEARHPNGEAKFLEKAVNKSNRAIYKINEGLFK